MYRQLEIWWVDLNPTQGAETRKKRPCVIVQSDLMNKSSRTLIIAPVLPHHRDWPFAVNVQPSMKNGLDKDRHLNLKQMRVIDLARIDQKLGVLEEKHLGDIQKAIGLVFGV